MGMGSTKAIFAALICVLCASLLFSFPVSAQGTSSSPADLADNEKVIYALPDIGSISPENPLFIFKRVRDGILLALPQDTETKTRLLIQMSDKYTVYADKLAHLSKTQRSLEMFQTTLGYQSTIIELFREESKKPDTHTNKAMDDLRYTALQSNIKQAETLRSLIDDIPTSEQSAFVELLEKNMQLRKKLQGI